MLLIHCITDNADTWRRVHDRLASAARAHAIDLPGHIIPVRVGHAVAAALPGARLSILPGIGHEPQHECVDETCRIIDAALAADRAAQSA